MLQCGHLSHEHYDYIFTLFVLFFKLILLLYSELANHIHPSMQRPRRFSTFFPRYFQSGAVIQSHNDKNIEKRRKNVCAIALDVIGRFRKL